MKKISAETPFSVSLETTAFLKISFSGICQGFSNRYKHSNNTAFAEKLSKAALEKVNYVQKVDTDTSN